MRASLVLDLVKSYHAGEVEFRNAVIRLADDEAKKGNTEFAKKLVDSVHNPSSLGAESKYISNSSSFSFSPSSATQIIKNIPADKDSALDLYEIISPAISFDDLVFDEVVQKLFKQIVVEWKKADSLLSAGMFPTRRVLLYGPPGCGKTTAGLALAKEIGLPVAYVRLDSVFSSFLGQTSTNLRRIFDSVKSGPIALFLDEFDAIAKKRDDNQEVGELKRVVISLLQNFDFLPPNVLVIAATNHHHLLDPAIWRRFDLSIPISPPNEEGRYEMLKLWLSRHINEQNVDIGLLSKITEGISASSLKDLIYQTVKTSLFVEEKESLQIEDFIKNLIIFEAHNVNLTLEEASLEWVKKMNERGISLRTLSQVTGIPRSTLSDQLKSYCRESDDAKE